MKRRDEAIEAVSIVLRNSCAADGCGDPDETLPAIAVDLVKVIEDVEAGASVEDAVLANWTLDETERRRVFGDGT